VKQVDSSIDGVEDGEVEEKKILFSAIEKVSQ